MLQIDSQTIYKHLPYREFIPFLRDAFTEKYTVPQRMHANFENGVVRDPSTLLIMPGWQDGEYLGVKTVTVSPHNKRFDLPTIQGIYQLFDAKNGSPLASFDAGALTARRTAAKSAIASGFLARKDSESLLMVGTGTLSTELIQAHCTMFPIKKVIIWEHTQGKGKKVIERLPDMDPEFSVTNDLPDAVPKADIISVATLSVEPLIHGKWMQPGQHLESVGAYREDMREADDEVLRRSTLFIDHKGAFDESGDLIIPIEKGVINRDDIKATLFDLCSGDRKGREDGEEITFFKSTGHALEDLSAALFIVQQLEIA